ncbi:zinc finger MYM-type protein 4 isoform X4 [Nothobranchius furzeri]|uniref:zinc finger MYM-type protein 4 isoform X4 n=1 Tax=Nothobranchius furzeri TaxID=105023 RepID=UPI00390474EB
MADSEEFRLKRLKHEEQMSRMFDEVMGLGDFADSSRGSVASSKSGGQTEAKGPSETLGLKENQPRDEDSSCSRKEGKMDEGTGEMNFPRRTSNKPSLFNLGGGVGGSGEAAFDDALDGLPLYGQEEEDEDWHFALPLDSMEDGDARKTNSNISQFGPQSSSSRGGPFPRKPADEEEEQQEREGSGESANTSHSSQDNTPDNSRDVLNQTEETEDSQQAETAEARPAEDCNPPASPGVKIKDEPIDEGYNAALLPQSSIRQIKEELEQQEEELRISSVYSVGGANTFTSPAMPAAIPIPTPTPTAIFIPGRGAVLQAMAPLPIRPPAVIQPPVPSLTAIPPRPPQPPAPGSVRCSGCTKVLLKGQTAFQRKGSTQLFCSTSCLTGHLPPATKYRSCFQCNREIIQPRDMVTIPGEENTYLQFCGQFCLSVFRHKRVQGDKIIDKRTGKKPQKPPEKPVERLPEKPICSVCKSTNKQIEHEVNHQGRLHKLCSNACFLAWRRLRQLAMNCCEGCGLYCNSSSGSCQVLTIEKTQLNFCSPTCVGTYKLTCRKMTECSNCHKSVLVSCTIMERDHKGKVQLYCTPSCVEQSRPPQHALSGTPFPCCLCKVSAVPQYHLAMVDGTIRNFCSYNCVSMFRKLGHVPQPELTNGTSSLRDPPNKDAPRPAPSAGASSVPPVPQDYPSSVPSHHSTHTSVPSLVPPPSVTPSPTVPGQVQAQSPPDETQKPTAGRFSDTVRVTCHQCSKQFSTKPLLLSHQGRISVFCCKTCSDQYKTQKNIVAPCESCKQEKVIYENFNYNQQDLFFCSENCKLLFKGDHQWRPCTYCSAVGDKMVLSHYGGKTEEFCRPHCMSQFTVLYYGMGRCDGCRKQGYMMEKLQCLGSVRNFCNMSCLLQYCYIHFEMSQHTSSNGTVPQMPSAPAQPHLSSKMNPVVGDVVSLANGSAAQPSVSADTSLSGALPASSVDGKNLDHASTQTDAMRVPAPRRRQMKNKSVLCRPFTLDQESTCQLLTAASESEALLDSSLHSTGVPARLTGRHFLGRRENSSDCMVCSRHKVKKRRRVVEGEEAVGKKQRMEEDGRERMEEDGREGMEEDGREGMKEDGREMMEEDGREGMKEDGREKMEEDGREMMKEDGREGMKEDGREGMKEDGREGMKEDGREGMKEDGREGMKEDGREKMEEDGREMMEEDGREMMEEDGREGMKEDGREMMEEDGREGMKEDGREGMKEDGREKKIEEVSKRKEDDDPGSQKEDNPEGIKDNPEGQKGNELERIKEDDPEREREDIPERLKENEEQDNLERKNESDPESKREDEEDGMSSSSEEKTDEEDSEISRTGSETSYYCKTCPEEPSLCPVPCFELYHTQLVYRTAPELEAQGEPPEKHPFTRQCQIFS